MGTETVSIVPICPILGGQSYLTPVAVGRWRVSREISQGARKLALTPQSSKKREKKQLLL